MTKRRLVIIISLIIVSNLLVANNPLQAKERDNFIVVDKQDKTIFQTAMEVTVGDYYINENNQQYKVIDVQGNKGIAEYEKKVDLLKDDKLLTSSEHLVAQKKEKKIGIYNTHSDESYKPTSGNHSEPGNGDIYQVSANFADELENKGVEAIHDKSKHDPHDGGAYERSRRTAIKLTKQRPDALFDFHRDGVESPQEYITEIDGTRTAQLRLVVGRQNPQIKVNSNFAKQIKAATDKKYPGLVKGIFYAKGKYNQDLSPRAMLVEAGTHVISQDMAASSVKLLADSINDLLYGKDGAAAKLGENSSSISSIIIILLVTLVVGGALYIANKRGVLNNGFSDSLGVSMEEKESIEDITKREDSDN
ncbi:MAG: stage II sporulation protein P [Bacillota bacterium]